MSLGAPAITFRCNSIKYFCGLSKFENMLLLIFIYNWCLVWVFKYSGKRNKICKWTVRHYVPRTKSLRTFWFAERRPRFLQTNSSFPGSFLASLAWPKIPKNVERRLFCVTKWAQDNQPTDWLSRDGEKKKKRKLWYCHIPPRFCSLSTVDVHVKLRAKRRTHSQHCWPNMLRVVVSVCTSINVWPVSNFVQQLPTTCNRVGVQTDATCDIQHCCVRFLHGALVKPSQS